MNSQTLDDLPSLLPMDFFALEIPLHEKEKKLPDFSDFLAEEPFAKVSAKKSEKGLHFFVDFSIAFEEAFWPVYRKGESVEILIDTRNNKGARYPTKFCHHFVFLPQSFEGVQKMEMTRLKDEEARPMAQPHHMQVTTTFKRNSFKMEIFLSTEALYGYDPSAFKKIGFAYRINRTREMALNFPVSSDLFDVAMHPNLWSTLCL